MLTQHRELFAVYWRWVEDWLAHALDTGRMWTVLGWECRTGITEFNQRSIANFPVQANGAEILRIACILAMRHGLGLRASVHDAFLIEAPLDRIDADVRSLAGIDAAGIARRSQPHRGRHIRTAHRRKNHSVSGPLHRPARRRDLGAGARAPRRIRSKRRSAVAQNGGVEQIELTPEQLAVWDAEIEADFHRAVAATKAVGRKKRGQRLVAFPMTFLIDVCRLTEGRTASCWRR